MGTSKKQRQASFSGELDIQKPKNADVRPREYLTGYKLANDGHDTRAIQQYLGHRNIQHTVRYNELRFKHLETGEIKRLGRIGKAQKALHCGFASLGPFQRPA